MDTDSESVISESYDCVNPSPPSELCNEEISVLRGDAIGSTAYSQRWLFATLHTVIKSLPYYLKSAPDDDSELNSATMEQNAVLELEEEVETAACHLWDMTAETEVSLHLLQMTEVDVLQVAAEVAALSRSSRLTEIMVGIVGNLCCSEEGCTQVLASSVLADSVIGCALSTWDVPTLVQVFRLLRMLLWHVVYRNESNASCQWVAAMRDNERLNKVIVFMLRNSLNDSLIVALTELLEVIVSVSLVDEVRKEMLIDYYANGDLQEALIDMIVQCQKSAESNSAPSWHSILHRCVYLLYSIALRTPFGFDEHYSLTLEAALATYLHSVVKSCQVPFPADECQHVIHCLGICERLVPLVQVPTVLMPVIETLTHLGVTDLNDKLVTNNLTSASEDKGIKCSELPCDSGLKTNQSEELVSHHHGNISANESLAESVGDYCVSLLQYSPCLKEVLAVLDQCHLEEVRHFFRAVKGRNAMAVAHLQEILLDKGIHQRLVTVLAEMYT